MRFIIIIFIPACIHAQIIISEFMPYPHAGQPEWIELHNLDSIYSFTAQHIWIEDASSRTRIENISIPPLGFLVICRDTMLLHNSIGLIDCPILQFSLPTLNNASDKIKIRNQDSILFDSIAYVFKKEFRGKSMERYTFSQKQDSLCISLNPKGNTCGFTNACNPLNNDLLIESIIGDTEAIIITIHNNGHTILRDITIRIISDTSLIQKQITELKRGENQAIKIYVHDIQFTKGMNQISIESMHALEDPRTYNNNGQFFFYHSYPKRSIIINEINVTENNYPEFVELRILDNSLVLSEGYACIIGRDTIDISMEESTEYVILTKEISEHISASTNIIYSKGLTISNAGTIIQILDPNGLVLDSIDYAPLINQYGEYIPTHSLEFIESLNDGTWFVSTHEQGATPGFMNSKIIHKPENKSVFRIDKCSQRFTNCKEIYIEHPFTIGIYSCDVYTLDGVFVISLIMDKLISGEYICPLPESNELSPSIYVLLHTIRDYYGSDTLQGVSTFIKRN